MGRAIATVEITSGPVIRGTGTKGSQPFEWEATLTATGWEIAISSLRGRIGSVTGATLNLPLEVAAAARTFTI